VDWIEDVAKSLGTTDEEARRIFEEDEVTANNMTAVPLIGQTQEYVGHCDTVPNVRGFVDPEPEEEIESEIEEFRW